MECYERALRLEPNSAVAWANKGNAYIEVECFMDAVDCFKRALAADPGEPFALWRLGLVLQQLGRLEEALEFYEAAVRRHPLEKMAWIMWATCLSVAGRATEALEKVDRALTLDPDEPMAWFTQAGVLGDLGRPEDSVAAYEEGPPGRAHRSSSRRDAATARTRGPSGNVSPPAWITSRRSSFRSCSADRMDGVSAGATVRLNSKPRRSRPRITSRSSSAPACVRQNQH